MDKKYKSIGIITIAVIVFIFLLASYVINGRDKLNKNNNEEIFVDTKATEDQQEIQLNDKKTDIVVEIKGEIKLPNIYQLKQDSIINDLIEKAGGLTELADTSKINRAEKLTDHQCIVIPNKNDAQSKQISSPQSTETQSKLININTAAESELDSLPGIGPARAKDIIKYRETNGGFKSIEEIKNIKGIGTSSFEKLKDLITI